MLMDRIAESNSNKLTKKDLRRQFKEYESMKNLLRKVHYQPEKSKKKREHSCDVTEQ